MTVKELIKELGEFDPEAKVLVSSDPEGNVFWGNCEVFTELFHPEWKQLVNIPDHDHSYDSEPLERVCVIWVEHPRYDGQGRITNMEVKVNTTVEKIEKVVVEEKEVKTYDLIGLTAMEIKLIEALVVGSCLWGYDETGAALSNLYETICKVSPSTPAFFVTMKDPRQIARRA